MHNRLHPRRHRFSYPLFFFLIDLDELATLDQKQPLITRNRRGVFAFHDADHMRMGYETVAENLGAYLRDKGVSDRVAKCYLLTHLRVFGYVFNPVSFYYCFDAENQPVCIVAEVSNTFHEMKAYFLGPDKLTGGSFKDKQNKDFYISPFSEPAVDLHFCLTPPGEKFVAGVNTSEDGKLIFCSTLVGERRNLTTGRLLFYLARFPLITLQIMALIHWQALKLFLKKVPFWAKDENESDQRGVVDFRDSRRKPI